MTRNHVCMGSIGKQVGTATVMYGTNRLHTHNSQTTNWQVNNLCASTTERTNWVKGPDRKHKSWCFLEGNREISKHLARTYNLSVSAPVPTSPYKQE